MYSILSCLSSLYDMIILDVVCEVDNISSNAALIMTEFKFDVIGPTGQNYELIPDDVSPWTYLSLFTAQKLEEIVCGKGFIDIEMLKRHTDYENDNDNECSPHIQNFWSISSEMFSKEQKKLFLIFVWG